MPYPLARHAVLQVQHLRRAPRPSRDTNADASLARSVSLSASRTSNALCATRRAIDPHEIARPEILDAGRIERDHLRARVQDARGQMGANLIRDAPRTRQAASP
jgi:hypothetical protein